jgi:hypothetical protein
VWWQKNVENCDNYVEIAPKIDCDWHTYSFTGYEIDMLASKSVKDNADHNTDKRIQKPDRIIRCHQLLQRAERNLVAIYGYNVLHRS